MKIEYIRDDLFKTDIKHILHGCNDRGVMGSGVAFHIRNKFPKAYESYVSIYQEFGLGLGEVFFEDCGEKIIINAISQKGFGRNGSKYVSYDAIDLITRKVDERLHAKGFTQVAMPKIGAGLGGGNWNVIEKIIEENMKSIQPVVYYIE